MALGSLFVRGSSRGHQARAVHHLSSSSRLRAAQPPSAVLVNAFRAGAFYGCAEEFNPLDLQRDAEAYGSRHSPTKNVSRDLLDYGYAPGNYMSRCLTCDQTMQDVDKRCRCCKPCAEAKMRAALGEESAQ
jgi:hypothetical protein